MIGKRLKIDTLHGKMHLHAIGVNTENQDVSRTTRRTQHKICIRLSMQMVCQFDSYQQTLERGDGRFFRASFIDIESDASSLNKLLIITKLHTFAHYTFAHSRILLLGWHSDTGALLMQAMFGNSSLEKLQHSPYTSVHSRILLFGVAQGIFCGNTPVSIAAFHKKKRTART